ncbi:MAG: hypothetical protein II852_00030 [Bacteroidales bacterium]|nr:hypothetical protein [Bacteroidales bacterium]
MNCQLSILLFCQFQSRAGKVKEQILVVFQYAVAYFFKPEDQRRRKAVA